MSKHARDIDPGPLIPTMQIKNDKGDVIIVNAEPVYDGYDDDKPAIRAHERAVRDHKRAMAEWAERGFEPAKAAKAKA